MRNYRSTPNRSNELLGAVLGVRIPTCWRLITHDRLPKSRVTPRYCGAVWIRALDEGRRVSRVSLWLRSLRMRSGSWSCWVLEGSFPICAVNAT